MINVQIQGLDELKQALNLAPQVVENEVNKGIKRAIIQVERSAKIKVPVDTGRLRASHQIEFTNFRGELFPTTDYAPFVHEGTRFMRARPWLMDAWLTERGTIETILNQAVESALRKVFK